MSKIYVTRKRIKGPFYWLMSKNKPVKIRVFYDNSMGMRQVREYKGILTDVKIKSVYYYDEPGVPPSEYRITFKMRNCIATINSNVQKCTDETVHEETIDQYTEVVYKQNKWLYLWNNSGPDCYLSIEFGEPVEDTPMSVRETLARQGIPSTC